MMLHTISADAAMRVLAGSALALAADASLSVGVLTPSDDVSAAALTGLSVLGLAEKTMRCEIVAGFLRL